jgi:hypothetical protein
MAGMSNYLEEKILNLTLRNVAYTPPTTVYVALYSTNPNETDTGTEISGGGYTRKSTTFSAPSNGAVSNSADIVFPLATADWGTVAYVGIRDAATGGNLLYYGPLAVSKVILASDQLIIPAGQLTISID